MSVKGDNLCKPLSRLPGTLESVKVKVAQSCLTLQPYGARQAPLSMGFSRQEGMNKESCFCSTLMPWGAEPSPIPRLCWGPVCRQEIGPGDPLAC